MRERRVDAGLSDDDWKAFGVQFVGDVDALLKERVRAVHAQLKRLEGPAPSDPPENPNADPAIALIADDADLPGLTLRLLERERDRLQPLVGVDERNARRYKLLSEKITNLKKALFGSSQAKAKRGASSSRGEASGPVQSAAR